MKSINFGILLVAILLTATDGQYLELLADIQDIILDKCKGEETTATEIATCIKSIEAPQQNASIEEMFKNLCKVYPDRYECKKKIQNCTSSEGLKLLNIDHELQEYICSKDKSPVSEFLAADGMECLNQTQNEIENCIKDFSYAFLTTHCSEIRTCVKHTLETCSSKITGNIVDEFFEIISKEIPCSNKENVNDQISTLVNYVRDFFLDTCKEDNTTLMEMGDCLESIDFKQFEINNMAQEKLFCKIYPDVYKCTNIIRNCVNSEGLKILNIEHDLMKHICLKEKEIHNTRGIECLNATRNELQSCIKDFNYTFLTTHCSEIRTCMKDKLESCPSNNFVELFFEIINNEIPCSNEEIEEPILTVLNYVDELVLDTCRGDNKTLADMGQCLESIDFQINDIIQEKSFCKVYLDIYKCTHTIRKCVNSEGLKILNIGHELIKYICLEEEDTVAEFFAAGCYNSTQKEIKNCVKDFKYTFVASHCSEIRTCLKDKLETCASNVTIVDVFFRTINSEIPCSNQVSNIAFAYLLLLLFLVKLF